MVASLELFAETLSTMHLCWPRYESHIFLDWNQYVHQAIMNGSVKKLHKLTKGANKNLLGCFRYRNFHTHSGTTFHNGHRKPSHCSLCSSVCSN